jgi:nicotinate-nucleotide adenylyltransferase
MDIGVIGGTFDPVHLGHLVAAEEVRVKLRLSSVIFLPAGQPWLKPEREITPAEHRLAMLKLAIGSNPDFRLSTLELDRPGPSYTVDSLPQIAAECPAGTNILFIIGLDKLAELPRWKEPQRLLELCWVVAVARPGYTDFDLKKLERAIPGASRRIRLLDIPLMGISSSDIRERVGWGLPIRYLVPPGVAEYIEEHGLYRK